MIDLGGKRALVMGLGVHGGGLGVARFLVGQGAHVTITDLRGADQLQPSLDALAGLPITYVLGRHRDDDFRAADLVIRNPGVPRESRYLQIARAAGAAIEMEMTLFFRLCPGPILGITGTKGKTTTTLLTGAMLRQQHPDTVVAGNLRVSALEALPRITAGTPVVLELSSWQLEGLGEAQLSPRYACVTNISPDHLDRYGSMEAYAEAKKQIFLHQGNDGIVVLNWDDALLREQFAAEAPGRVIWFSNGAGPVAHEERGSYYRDNSLYWSSRGQSQDELIGILDNPNLPGGHNRANVAAAAALAKAFGIINESIRAAIRSFPGVEHRLELVRELDGVRYINDTTATAPEAAVAALRSFDAPIVLIAGGADKTLPFDGLARAIVERAKAVVLLAGTATPKLEAAVSSQQSAVRSEALTGDWRLRTMSNQQSTVSSQQSAVRSEALTGDWRLRTMSSQQSAVSSQQSTVRSEALTGDWRLRTVVGPFDDFARAIAEARGLAAPGDVVLLSPGCASFGMFRNEFHRGEEFRRIVNQLETV